MDWLKIWPLVINLKFLSNQADIQAILPTHELVTLTNFQRIAKIVHFLVIAKF